MIASVVTVHTHKQTESWLLLVTQSYLGSIAHMSNTCLVLNNNLCAGTSAEVVRQNINLKFVSHCSYIFALC